MTSAWLPSPSSSFFSWRIVSTLRRAAMMAMTGFLDIFSDPTSMVLGTPTSVRNVSKSVVFPLTFSLKVLSRRRSLSNAERMLNFPLSPSGSGAKRSAT